MIKRDFERALKEDDFSVGERFWLGSFKFEVVDVDLGLNMVTTPEVLA